MTTDEPQLMTMPRRRGRPKASVPCSALTAWVPQTYHDRLAKLALKHGVSVSSVVVRVLQQAIDRQPR